MNETLSPYGAVRPASTPSAGRTAAAWTALILLALLCAAAAFVAVWFIFFGYSAGCGEAADAATVWEGRRALLYVLAVAAFPWAVTCMWAVRYRIAIGVAGAIAIAPALYGLAVGFSGGAWDSGWCF